MKTENITIANLSCGGCVKTITKKLTEIDGVNQLNVDLETSIVTVEFDNPATLDQITDKLLSIGYPEATEKNGLLTKMKSITSCMSGKIS